MTGKELMLRIGRNILPPGRLGPDDPGFVINSEPLIKSYESVYRYLTNDQSSDKPLNPSKALMFCGGEGCGKTTCMKVIQRMALFVNGLESREMCIVDVNTFIKVYTDKDAGPKVALDMYGYEKSMDMCIEELGWEATQSNIFGNNTSSIVATWIMERYDLFVDKGIRTHFVTNLKIREKEVEGKQKVVDLEDLYGPRVIGRMREMVSVVNWVGGSLRK